ncbi:hypothetical protein SLE2022_086920 [Rubroshorea leprosula]
MEETELVSLCLEAACKSEESVEKWRRQRRTLERLPSHLAQSLLQRLLHRRLLFPSLLEVFKYSVEEIDLRGQNSVDAEWMAYIGAFRYLRYLSLADCHRVTNSALWPMIGMACLKELDLSRCTKVTDAGVRDLISISTLEKLWISETRITADGVALLSSLENLSVLDLGGLPVTDKALNSLQLLTKLEYLDLWGSKISNGGAGVLQSFPKLSFLNLAWTSITNLPDLLSLECLNMSNCTINSVLHGTGDKAPLTKLIFSGATFIDGAETFLYVEKSLLLFLDISNSSLHRFSFLSYMEMLEHLDLSSSMLADDSVEHIVCIGANLRYLNLSSTKVSSTGVGVLAGHVPKLEILSLSHTSIDDMALLYIGMMLSLKVVDLSNTNIKGSIPVEGMDCQMVSSLAALQNLACLERLVLEQTQVRDADLSPLSSCKELSHLSLNCASLTDATLHVLASLPRLTYLSICEAVLTNSGLDSFTPPAALRVLDLRDCWLLTEDAVLLFSKKHPQIEVRHEAVPLFSSELVSSNRASLSQPSSRTSRMKSKQKNMPLSQFFIDQRLKYSREELLALQYSFLSLNSPDDTGIILSELQLDPIN